MERTQRILVIAGLALTTLGTECRLQTDPNSTTEQDVPVVVGDPFDIVSWVEDEYTIHDVRVTGNQLSIDLRFSGGCKDHDFRLIRASTFMESDPVQLHVLLAHDGHDDACEAILQPTLTIDITSIRNAWRQAYHGSSGSVILRLFGWDDPIRYDF